MQTIPKSFRLSKLAYRCVLSVKSLKSNDDIGNWLELPEELHMGRLLTDGVVCLVSAQHPAAHEATGRGWTAERYLDCKHVAPSPLQGNSPGVIDEHLAAIGVRRDVAVRSAHFGLIPKMVAQSLLVLTTGRSFCSRYVTHLPVCIVPCPVPFPPLNYYQLWHDLTHASASGRWLREQVREVARGLRSHASAVAREPAPVDRPPTELFE